MCCKYNFSGLSGTGNNKKFREVSTLQVIRGLNADYSPFDGFSNPLRAHRLKIRDRLESHVSPFAGND